jgi:hypothetical protein
MVTLQQIKNAHPCINGWKKVRTANGGVNADMDKPFPLASIIDSNGLDDALWVISNVTEMSEHDEIWRKFSSWCALQNIEKIEKYCSKEDYELIVNWLETNDASLRESAKVAAWAATEAANEAVAWDTSWPTRAAAWDASWTTQSDALVAAQAAAWATQSSALAATRAAAWATQSAALAATQAAVWAARSAARSAARPAAWAARAAAEVALKEKLRELLGQ